MRFFADTDKDAVRNARPSDAQSQTYRTEDAAWIQLINNATCRCAGTGNRAANARAELRKLEAEALANSERLSKLMDDAPWSARQFRENALEVADKASEATP